MLDWGADAQGGGVGERSMDISRSNIMAGRSLASKQIKSGGDRLNQSVVDNKYKLNQRKCEILKRDYQ